jgi:hypothetical protein
MVLVLLSWLVAATGSFLRSKAVLATAKNEMLHNDDALVDVLERKLVRGCSFEPGQISFGTPSKTFFFDGRYDACHATNAL